MVADGLQTLDGELSIAELQPVIKTVRRRRRAGTLEAAAATPRTPCAATTAPQQLRLRLCLLLHPRAQALHTTLAEASYDAGKVAAWSAAVHDGVLKGLCALARPYKFIVTCVIMQRAGGGLHTAAAALWDAKKDGMCVRTRVCICALTRQPPRRRAPSLLPIPSSSLLLRALARARSCSISWENSTMHCIVTVVGLALTPSAQESEA